MSKLTSLVKTEIRRIVIYQLLMILACSAMFILLSGFKQGLSVAMGAMTYWLPTYIFMIRVSAHTGARAAIRFMVAFFVGEVIKLVLCGILFLIAIKYLQLQLLYGLLGLISGIIAFWIASITVLFQTRVKL